MEEVEMEGKIRGLEEESNFWRSAGTAWHVEGRA